MEESIEQSEQDPIEQSNEMEFYIVSPKKFLILFLGTFGIYTVYWFFKHWSLFKKSTDGDLWPVMRAIFAIFFTHSLFSYFEERYKNKTGEAPRSINHLATIYVIVSIGGQIASRFSGNDYENPASLFLSLLILPVTCWILYQAQSLANYSGDDVKGRTNDELTFLNYGWLVLGSIFWLLILLGLYATIVGI